MPYTCHTPVSASVCTHACSLFLLSHGPLFPRVPCSPACRLTTCPPPLSTAGSTGSRSNTRKLWWCPSPPFRTPKQSPTRRATTRSNANSQSAPSEVCTCVVLHVYDVLRIMYPCIHVFMYSCRVGETMVIYTLFELIACVYTCRRYTCRRRHVHLWLVVLTPKRVWFFVSLL